MKKILAIAAILTLLAMPAFASMTELMSLGNLPAQISGTDQIVRFYPQLISNFKNTAVVEYGLFVPGVIGYTFVGTGLGTIGIAATPSYNLSGDMPSTAFEPDYATSLIYGTDLGGMNVGASLILGNYGTGTVNKMVATIADKDEVSNGYSLTTITLGASLKAGLALDLGLSFALPGYSNLTKTYNTTNQLTNDNLISLGGMEIGLNAGTKMGSWMFDLGLVFTSGSYSTKTWTDADANGTPETNSLVTTTDGEAQVNLIAGYKLQATKTMSFIFGSGLNFYTTADPKTVTENKITAVKTYSTAANSGMNIYLPLNVAINCKLNDTWSFMAGVQKTILRFTANNTKTVLATDGKTVTNESNSSTVDMDYGLNGALGVTAQLGDLKVEWNINPMLILYGPDFVSGRGIVDDNTTPLATSVALTYGW